MKKTKKVKVYKNGVKTIKKLTRTLMKKYKKTKLVKKIL